MKNRDVIEILFKEIMKEMFPEIKTLICRSKSYTMYLEKMI